MSIEITREKAPSELEILLGTLKGSISKMEKYYTSDVLDSAKYKADNILDGAKKM